MEDFNKIELDHIDIVTTHLCNKNCPHCIDKFVNTDKTFIKVEYIERFLKLVRKHTSKDIEVLLLGGEPTCTPKETLIAISELVHRYGFRLIMSTNGILKKKIVELLPYFDSIQVTVNTDEEIAYYSQWPDKINIKVAGDENFTYEKFEHFIDVTKQFDRRSISMYFTEDWKELCTDERIWAVLNTLKWKRNGSYEYAFFKGVRIKRGIPGETNLIDEPTVPKLYPNGNYNKTWNDEIMDAYLGEL